MSTYTLVERRRDDRRRGDRRQSERRQGDRRAAVRRQDHQLRLFLASLMDNTSKLGHRLLRFDVLSASGTVVVRSKCHCGEWVRAHLSDASRECVGPALKKRCRLAASGEARQLRLL